jgi:hypothetical protein
LKILENAGINVNFNQILYDAYVPKAKSTAVKIMLDGNYDALLLIDYDLEFEIDAIPKLIIAKKEIIGGVYPLKSCEESYPGDICIGEDKKPITDESGTIFKSTFIPGGFLLIRRSAIIKMEDCGAKLDEESGIRYYFDTGFTFDDDRRWYGEDKTFCRYAIECGIDLWVHPDITFSHYGVGFTTGNYNDFLRKGEAIGNKTCLRKA